MWGQLSTFGEKLSQQAANLKLDEQLVRLLPDHPLLQQQMEQVACVGRHAIHMVVLRTIE
jgi:hypothetical protein